MISSFVFPQECLIQCEGWTVLGMNQHNTVKESVVCKSHLSFVEEVRICVSNELGCQGKKGWSCSWGSWALLWRMSLSLSLPKRSCEIPFWERKSKTPNFLRNMRAWVHILYYQYETKCWIQRLLLFSHFRENVVCNHIKSCFARELYKCILCTQYTILYNHYSYLKC